LCEKEAIKNKDQDLNVSPDQATYESIMAEEFIKTEAVIVDIDEFIENSQPVTKRKTRK
jgi:hypothetical protein